MKKKYMERIKMPTQKNRCQKMIKTKRGMRRCKNYSVKDLTKMCYMHRLNPSTEVYCFDDSDGTSALLSISSGEDIVY